MKLFHVDYGSLSLCRFFINESKAGVRNVLRSCKIKKKKTTKDFMEMCKSI